MEQSLNSKEQLNLETAEVCWAEIEVFFAQGKLLIVEENQDLVEVAALIADNQVEPLKTLIDKKQVSFASPEWVKENCDDTKFLWAVVVAPYVLAQLKSD